MTNRSRTGRMGNEQWKRSKNILRHNFTVFREKCKASNFTEMPLLECIKNIIRPIILYWYVHTLKLCYYCLVFQLVNKKINDVGCCLRMKLFSQSTQTLWYVNSGHIHSASTTKKLHLENLASTITFQGPKTWKRNNTEKMKNIPLVEALRAFVSPSIVSPINYSENKHA